jgi:transcriptional regulator with XRE-family HTH domain
MSIGEKLRVLRYSAKMTLQQQGKLFGVSANSVYRWEHNLNIPRLPVLKDISDYYDVPIEWLVGSQKEFSGVPRSQQEDSGLSEHQLIRLYRDLPENCKHKALGYIERLYLDAVDK